MEHKGTVRSIKQNSMIQTNKTLRHCYPTDNFFCRDEFFVLPKGMTRAQALTKIEHASIANKIMKEDRNFDCLQKEMQKDLVLLGFPKGTTWADLTHAQKKKVESLSLVQGSEDGVSESQSTKAAKRIMNNQQRLEEHSDDLEKLGLGENRIWNNLSAAEHKKIKELAESEWVELSNEGSYVKKHLVESHEAGEKALQRNDWKDATSSKPVNTCPCYTCTRWSAPHEGVARSKWRAEAVKDYSIVNK
ncbi:hypothetical protein HDU79_004631 [Rhizoclosmatium sp. JEL0117]|nr:hypothetical protein HDU79_004631 [Rhizoclosmatium sp. JEL0117]